MRKLDHFEVPVLIPMIKEVQAACGQPDQSDVDYCLSQMAARIEAGTGSVFIDSLDNPGAVAVLYMGDSLYKKESICHVMLVYVRPEKRTTAMADEIIRTCIEFATAAKAGRIYGSSWEFKGVTAGIGSAWERFGFQKQETIFTKIF